MQKGFYPYEWVDGVENQTMRGFHLLRLFFRIDNESVLYDDGDGDKDNEATKKVIIKENHEHCLTMLDCIEVL